jgi:hypothetical protein
MKLPASKEKKSKEAVPQIRKREVHQGGRTPKNQTEVAAENQKLQREVRDKILLPHMKKS